MRDLAIQFRQAAATRRGGKRSPGRYPNELKKIALQHLAAVRQRGGRPSHAARELGIDANTLRVWEKRNAASRVPGQSVLPVSVSASAVEPRCSGQFIVQVPGGLRIECANAGSVSELVAVLS